MPVRTAAKAGMIIMPGKQRLFCPQMQVIALSIAFNGERHTLSIRVIGAFDLEAYLNESTIILRGDSTR